MKEVRKTKEEIEDNPGPRIGIPGINRRTKTGDPVIKRELPGTF